MPVPGCRGIPITLYTRCVCPGDVVVPGLLWRAFLLSFPSPPQPFGPMFMNEFKNSQMAFRRDLLKMVSVAQLRFCCVPCHLISFPFFASLSVEDTLFIHNIWIWMLFVSGKGKHCWSSNHSHVLLLVGEANNRERQRRAAIRPLMWWTKPLILMSFLTGKRMMEDNLRCHQGFERELWWKVDVTVLYSYTF